MEIHDLKTTIRKTSGDGPAKALRRKGLVPAVLYGPGSEPVSLCVNLGELEQVISKSVGSQVLLNLTIQNGKETQRTAIIKELQQHPISRNILHVDFYEISMDRKIKVNVPIVTTGKCVGIENGGILQIVRRELEVLCLPLEIPESIEIDVTDLDIGGSIHVDELPLGDNIEISEDVNFTVVTVVAPKIEEEPVEEELEEELEGEAEEGEVPTEETDASKDEA